ncbi:MAG: TorF family putative porin [Gammaproteobacteria bacterium]
MKPANTAVLAITVLVAFLASSPASGSEGTTAVSLGFTTDYQWRGYSKSDATPSVQANVDYAAFADGSGWFAGLWAATVDFGSHDAGDAGYELVPYAGWSEALGEDFRLDLQLSGYFYDGDVLGLSGDYAEVYLFAHYRDLLTLEYAFAPQAYGSDANLHSTQLNGRYPLWREVEASAGVGFSWARRLFEYDYLYWNAGLTWTLAHAALDLRYFGAADTNEGARNARELDQAKASVVLTVSIGFKGL